MAKAVKLIAEQFEEEIARLNEEIRVSQQELNETLALNTDFANKIERKDCDLLVKDDRLKVTREKNAAELEQLQVEVVSMRERTTHEINFHMSEVSNLRMSKQRQIELVQENERLKQSIEILEEMTRQDLANHAIKMHEMNKGRRDLRIIMEDKLRKELAGIEVSFHKEAFQALHERQKLAMFENAKLKDEVAIQGVGITNLSARLLRQQKFREKCVQQLQVLQTKAKKLRDQLAIATQHRNDIQRQRETLTKEYEECTTQTKLLLARYNQAKSSSKHESISQQLLDKYATTLRNWREIQAQCALWRERYSQLTAVHLELKPTSEMEQNGQYSPSVFPIGSMLEELKNNLRNSVIGSDNAISNSRYSILRTILQRFSSSDNKALQDALQPAFHRNLNLLTTVEVLADNEQKLHNTQRIDLEDDDINQLEAMKEEAEINGQDMIAWSVLKVITLWDRSSSLNYNPDEFEEEIQQAVMHQQLVLSTPQAGSLRSAGTAKSVGSSIASFSPQRDDLQSQVSLQQSNKDDDDNSSYASEHTLDNINEGDNEEQEEDAADDDNGSSTIDGGEQKEEVFDTFNNPDPKPVRPVTSSGVCDDGTNRDGFDDLPPELSVSQQQTMLALSPQVIKHGRQAAAAAAEEEEQEEQEAAWTKMNISPRSLQLQIQTEETSELAREQEFDKLMLATSSSFSSFPAAAMVKGNVSSSWLKPLPKYTTNVFVQELQSTLQPKNLLVVHSDDEVMRYEKDAFEIGPPLIKHLKVSSSVPSLSHQPMQSSAGPRSGSKQKEAFDMSFGSQELSSSVSGHHSLSALKKSNDPLLQQKKKLLNNKVASAVQVSSKVLRQLPKSLSQPLLQQQKANSSSMKKSTIARSEALLELFES